MALVNPNIAMSFRQPEFRPRNALAEYAQVQQIMGGQRQAEMADMQMESLRRERDALGQIQAAIVAKGGPPDLEAAADAMIRTGRPEYLTQGMAIRTALRNQREAEAYRRDFGGGAAAPSAAATAGANAMVAPAAAPAGELVAAPMPSPTGTVRNIAPGGAVGPETSIAQNLASFRNTPPKGTKDIFGGQLSQEDKQRIEQYPGIKDRYETYSKNAAFFLNTPPDDYYYRNNVHLLAEQAKELSDLTGVKVPGTVEELRRVLNIGQPAAQPPAAANALAPAAAAPVTNAMVAPAAQPVAAVPAAAAAPDANAARLRALEAQYRRIGNNPELASEKALVLKQIEAALRADPSETRTMQQLGYPLTQEGYAAFRAAQMKTATPAEPSELRTMDALGYPRTREGYAAFRAAQMRETQQQPPALVPILRDGKPVLVPRNDAIGQTPFSPAAVQVLGMGPSAQAPAAAQPRPLTAAQEVARRDKLGKEFKSATAALQTTQDVLDSISFVKSEPGLSRATGFTGMLPSFPEGAAASAETRLANLKGKITALGKAAAASTGAIGSIASQEWKILSDQIAAIDPVKGKGPLLDQLALVEVQAQGAMARIQDAYQRQFGEDFERFPQFSNLPAPRSSFTPRAPAGGARGAAPPATGVDTSNPLLQ